MTAPGLYHEFLDAMMRLLPNRPVSLTMDGVALTVMDMKYMVATVSFTYTRPGTSTPVRSDICIGVFRMLEECTIVNLKEAIMNMLAEFDIRIDEVAAVTADGASNMQCAGSLLGIPGEPDGEGCNKRQAL